jgi:hypothetical protein
VLGVVGLVVGIAGKRGRWRTEGLGLGVVALVLGALLLVQARIDPALAVSTGSASDPPRTTAATPSGAQRAVNVAADPKACTVPPRTIAEINHLTAATTPPPPAAPLTPAADPTVDSATQAAIATTMTQYVACSNGQDPRRWLALFSDAGIQRSFPVGTTPSLTQTVATPPVPLPQTQWATLTGITGYTKLADGRVEVQIAVTVPGGSAGAAAMPDGMMAGTSGVTAILIKQGDRWLIDELGMAGM